MLPGSGTTKCSISDPGSGLSQGAAKLRAIDGNAISKAVAVARGNRPSPCPCAGAMAGAFIIGASAWTVQGWRYGAQLSAIKADWAEERALSSQMFAAEQDKARIEELRRFDAITEVSNEGQKKLDQIVLAERAAADERVRDAVNEYAKRHRQTASNTHAASSGQTIADPIGLLAELFGELDDMAGVYAGQADRARVAGSMCERSFDALVAR